MPKTGELCASYISGYLKTEKFDMRNPESKPGSGIFNLNHTYEILNPDTGILISGRCSRVRSL